MGVKTRRDTHAVQAVLLYAIDPHPERVKRLLDVSPGVPVLVGPLEKAEDVVGEGVEELGASVLLERVDPAGGAQHVHPEHVVGVGVPVLGVVLVLVLVVLEVVVVLHAVLMASEGRPAGAVAVVGVVVGLPRDVGVGGGGGGRGEEEPQDVRSRGVLHGVFCVLAVVFSVVWCGGGK